MTFIQEAAEIMERMPEAEQQAVVDFLRSIRYSFHSVASENVVNESFKRTGKAKFEFPLDFDEHFDDANEDIAALFYGNRMCKHQAGRARSRSASARVAASSELE